MDECTAFFMSYRYRLFENMIFVDSTADRNYQKDNYFLGVQSVEGEDHESLVVIPKPVQLLFDIPFVYHKIP